MANPKKGYPKRNEGANGDLSLNITPTGLGLFGKINNQWYRFGAAQEIGNKGRQNDKDNYFKQDVSLGNTSIQKQLKIGNNILETSLGGLGLSTS